jgi:hypothetical protein
MVGTTHGYIQKFIGVASGPAIRAGTPLRIIPGYGSRTPRVRLPLDCVEIRT